MKKLKVPEKNLVKPSKNAYNSKHLKMIQEPINENEVIIDFNNQMKSVSEEYQFQSQNKNYRKSNIYCEINNLKNKVKTSNDNSNDIENEKESYLNFYHNNSKSKYGNNIKGTTIFSKKNNKTIDLEKNNNYYYNGNDNDYFTTRKIHEDLINKLREEKSQSYKLNENQSHYKSNSFLKDSKNTNIKSNVIKKNNKINKLINFNTYQPLLSNSKSNMSNSTVSLNFNGDKNQIFSPINLMDKCNNKNSKKIIYNLSNMGKTPKNLINNRPQSDTFCIEDLMMKVNYNGNMKNFPSYIKELKLKAEITTLVQNMFKTEINCYEKLDMLLNSQSKKRDENVINMYKYLIEKLLRKNQKIIDNKIYKEKYDIILEKKNIENEFSSI